VIIRRILTTFGAIASAGVIALTGAAPASASGSVHDHRVYKNGWLGNGKLSGEMRITEKGDTAVLCDMNNDHSYVTAFFFWGNKQRFKLTDGDDRGCAISTASGRGYPKKANIPEGVTVDVVMISTISGDGRDNGHRSFSFKNNH
jgi:hypothetical protein